MTAMTLRTNICAHCQRPKEEHRNWPSIVAHRVYEDHFYCGDVGGDEFYDSGLKRLHEHAEELYEAVEELMEINLFNEPTRAVEQKLKIQSILSTIKTDKP